MPDHERILVTGGAGFVGSNVALALKGKYPQSRVTAFDNLHRRGSELNLARLREAGVSFAHGDIRSLADLTGLPELPDLIVECSAEPSAQAGYGGSPAYLIDTNLTGCYHCLELARMAHADFVFISTSRVYPYRRLNELVYEEGPERFHLSAEQSVVGASGLGVSEDFPLEGARSLYGMTKLAGELMVAEYGDAYGIRYLIDRCGVLTGPWQMAKADQGVIALWMAAHYFRKNLAYIGFDGSGRQVRDYLHIGDFCELLLEQIGNFETYQGRLLNVGGTAVQSFAAGDHAVVRGNYGQPHNHRTSGGNTAGGRSYLFDRSPAIDGLEWLAAAAGCADDTGRHLRMDTRVGGASPARARLDGGAKRPPDTPCCGADRISRVF